MICGPETVQVYGALKVSREISSRVQDISFNTIQYPVLLKHYIAEYLTKRYIYPWIVKKSVKQGNIKHITFQDYAFIASFLNNDPVIISCLDLIEPLYYHKKSTFLLHNLAGLKRADYLVTISEFSKKQIIEFLSYPDEQIYVISMGVNHSLYYPQTDRKILEQFSLSPDNRVILYVGSEEPRKNVDTILWAVSLVRKRIPGIVFLKVGNPQWAGAREDLIHLIDKLHLEGSVVFTGYIPEEDLPKYYNAADLFVFPSSYEGFGLPVLEAMACGCPVVTSNCTSIPEVVGDAAIMVTPGDVDELAHAIERVLFDDGLREEMTQKGIRQSMRFTWDKAAEKMVEMYKRVFRREIV